LFDRVVELLDRAARDELVGVELAIDVLAQFLVLARVGGVVIVEVDVEALEVAQMLAVHALDQGLRCDAFLLGAQHDRRAVRVVGADVVHRLAPHALKPYPDVGLDISDQMAQVDRSVGVGQRVGDEGLFVSHSWRAAAGVGARRKCVKSAAYDKGNCCRVPRRG